ESIEKGEARVDAEIEGGALARVYGLRVLLVEDNEFNQQVAQELLSEAAGIKVTVASNGQEALDRLEATPFDLVLLDIQMPVMNGYAVAERMRKSPRLARIPIIAMTANATTQDRERCLASGMDDYVTKPFVLSELLAALAKHAPARQMPAGISVELGLKY